jgi:hypothetical protein
LYFFSKIQGLADPAPVAQTFFVDDDIQANYSLDAIVTMVFIFEPEFMNFINV